jgi:hypothetical protein
MSGKAFEELCALVEIADLLHGKPAALAACVAEDLNEPVGIFEDSHTPADSNASVRTMMVAATSGSAVMRRKAAPMHWDAGSIPQSNRAGRA